MCNCNSFNVLIITSFLRKLHVTATTINILISICLKLKSQSSCLWVSNWWLTKLKQVTMYTKTSSKNIKKNRKGVLFVYFEIIFVYNDSFFTTASYYGFNISHNFLERLVFHEQLYPIQGWVLKQNLEKGSPY